MRTARNAHRSTLDYLEEVRSKIGKPGEPASDYAAAKALRVRPSTISRYRNGHGGFDDAVAIRAADLLGLPAETVVLDIQIERDAPPEVRRLWERIAARVSAASLSAAVAAVAVSKSLVCILC